MKSWTSGSLAMAKIQSEWAISNTPIPQPIVYVKSMAGLVEPMEGYSFKDDTIMNMMLCDDFFTPC